MALKIFQTRRVAVVDAQRVLLLLVTTWITTLVSSENTNQVMQQTASHENDSACTLYLAESTIPNAGLGIFTTIPRMPGDVVGEGGDICIPQINMEYHHYDQVDPFEDYVWSGLAMKMDSEGFENMDVINAFCPGLDAAMNCHPGLFNVDRMLPTWDNSDLHRSKDPGVGAFSPYQNPGSKVLRHIPAGGELFKFYGENWFQTRQDVMGVVALPRDQKRADRLLRKFRRIAPPGIQQSLYDHIIDLGDIWHSKNESVQFLALPRSWKDAEVAIESGDLASLHQSNATRSIEWLQKNGVCLDNLRVGPSMLPQAGNGAFSKQKFAAGDTITTSPLLQVFNKTLADMYRLGIDEETGFPERDERMIKEGTQLFLNYCFGHGSTSALLCPYGSTVNMINHNQSMANVRIEWASDGVAKHNSDSLKKSLPSLRHMKMPRLSFSYIATRDIDEGEELFLDYGRIWEQKWTTHKGEWLPDETSQNYVSAKHWNNEELSSLIKEYPENLEVRCHGAMLFLRRWRAKRLPWNIATIEFDPELGYPCELTGINKGKKHLSYNVSINVVLDDDTTITAVPRSFIPRDAFRFFERPHTSDIHLTTTFRHEISLPDEMVPKAWKNIQPEKKLDKHLLPIEKCELFMAESTIPGAGLGIFTGKPLNIDDLVGAGDVAIPLVELTMHHEYDTDFHDPLASYTWDGTSIGIGNLASSEDLSMFWPGLNAAVNCFPPLINVEQTTPDFDMVGLHRAKDPGTGAFSPYHNGRSRVIRPVQEGGELYKDYGDGWFLEREDFKDMPVVTDFSLTQLVLEQLEYFEFKSSELYGLVVELMSTWKPRMSQAFPSRYEDALDSAKDISVLHDHGKARPLEWLRKHGKCMDHIEPNNSTLKNAGHGAFAKRDLPEGTLITGSPLLHVYRDYFDMYNFTEDVNTGEFRKEEHIGYQLFLNYCYGHSKSSLILCPYGSGVNYINHNQTLRNVEVQWAAHGSSAHNSSWLSLRPTEMQQELKPHLGLDFVATKDIRQGDELFLDYGDEWEKAWNTFLNSWTPLEEEADYLSASAWNDILKTDRIRTEVEQIEEPYPDNLLLRCHTVLKRDNWNDYVIDWQQNEYGFDCFILERYEDGDTSFYQVQINYLTSVGRPKALVREAVPREAIQFIDKPYTSDILLRGAFRHHIGLPESITPKEWIDIDSRTAQKPTYGNQYAYEPKEEL